MTDMSDLLSDISMAAKPMPWKPEIHNAAQDSDAARLKALLDACEIKQVSDDFDEQLRELFAYNNPTMIFSPDFSERFEEYRSGLVAEKPLWQRGRWIYYPWRNALVHVLEEAAFQDLRTSRNRNLITADEQRKFSAATVGVVGLSVGNSIALTIVLQGGANRIRLADFDRLALSNINRVRSSVVELGSNKAEMTARQIYELNPYAEVSVFTDGLTPENIDVFFDGPPKLDVVIDEIDNLAVKCLIREQAKARRMPVLMAADNGDNGVLDIERYDLNPNTPFFHGRMGEVSYDMLKNLDKLSIGRLITKHVGARTVTPRMRASLMEIGKTIVSWPQLGGAAILNGPSVAYALRNIVCGHPLEDNRALIDLDEKLVPGHNSPEVVEKRNREADEFAKGFGI